MKAKVQLDEKNFSKMEQRLLSQIMSVSKSVLESFKFRMIYGTKITRKKNQQTLKALKEFRTKNWKTSVTKKEAYKKYLNSP